MNADHHHSSFEIFSAGQPVDHDLLGKFVGAAFDGCSCQGALLTLMVDDPATIAHLVELTCVSSQASFGGLPAYLIDDRLRGPASPEFRQLARLHGANTTMVTVCREMTSHQRRCAVHTAVDLLVGNLHLSRQRPNVRTAP